MKSNSMRSRTRCGTCSVSRYVRPCAACRWGAGLFAKDAFRIFTIDKVLGSLIKQVQLVLADARSQELLEVVKRERALSVVTNQDQLNSRRGVECILGPEENVHRIEWVRAG